MKQQQFLEVIERDEAERRWRATLDIAALPAETVALDYFEKLLLLHGATSSGISSS